MERMLLPGEIRQKIDGIFVFKLNDNGLVVIRYENVPRIIVANPAIKLELQK